ncbi:choline dehydrogenase [Amycolatopsis mediterranei S699]|uniref:Choline dehydrogenase n=2 Tax=Amycolatopsis mediterranei TaxID=33910 RepID=A0A0H3DFW8_AMYMU|nr:GMC family oxidoreductase N-terminal domain-containing protein [Amycolatopsis mediterranei]ADJ48564.1 choline dehydrogenase [Amycolatopsis mediterranei U32]AEK45494.1 choline dehydrogenase [Amycolatopsis mediterranei S699]AFO80273.1 choline dehydrogenase [Amycolatopsis mediterranei S699]AGT87401.1 choline dehydrogenase [Amycolatopsis mediterranei RB]KDO11044.1 choline dehydrogenase [Amycolatopsis mediterranei]
MYDYVIVGAGSAGCVLAARLSEDPDVKVCLLEAGPADNAENIHVPSAFATLFRTRYDWDYDSHDEPALNGRRVFLPRGRVLGGTSSLNAMIYARGNRLDFDEWETPGWTYDEILPYFKRSEDNERGADEFHGAGGPLTVSNGRSNNPSAQAFVDAAVEAGLPANDDFNGKNQDGFGFFQVTTRDGRRCSTAVAFLHPVLGRPNLTVETNFQAHRVLIENGRAVGVAGQRLDEELTIRADREVILSAGAYNSPQLLMLSGVGPAAQLGMLGIPVVADLPEVGQNLQDHALVPLTFTHSQPVSLLTAMEPQNIRRFVEEGTGPTASNGPEAGGFARTRSGIPAPDVEFFAAPIMFVDSGLAFPTAHAISCGPALLTPESRGSVTLASADPTAKPRIVHNYLLEEADMVTAVEALRMGLHIARQPAMRPYTEELFRAPESESDQDLRAYVRRWTHSIFHASGSCAIGTVVDASLRVHGVDGLRVADASVMPKVGRGQPNAAAIAIGEKAADLIKHI